MDNKLILFGCGLLASATVQAQEAQRPNIIYIIASSARPCQRRSFLEARVGKIIRAITPNMTGISKTRDIFRPVSSRVFSQGTSKGARETATPETSTRLKTLAPMTLPTPREA